MRTQQGASRLRRATTADTAAVTPLLRLAAGKGAAVEIRTACRQWKSDVTGSGLSLVPWSWLLRREIERSRLFILETEGKPDGIAVVTSGTGSGTGSAWPWLLLVDSWIVLAAGVVALVLSAVAWIIASFGGEFLGIGIDLVLVAVAFIMLAYLFVVLRYLTSSADGYFSKSAESRGAERVLSVLSRSGTVLVFALPLAGREKPFAEGLAQSHSALAHDRSQYEHLVLERRRLAGSPSIVGVLPGAVPIARAGGLPMQEEPAGWVIGATTASIGRIRSLGSDRFFHRKIVLLVLLVGGLLAFAYWLADRGTQLNEPTGRLDNVALALYYVVANVFAIGSLQESTLWFTKPLLAIGGVWVLSWFIQWQWERRETARGVADLIWTDIARRLEPRAAKATSMAIIRRSRYRTRKRTTHG